jgi:copper chaperone NosL
MHLSRPGFAGELRARDGTLAKYDDVGCLVRALLSGGGDSAAAWVEDHAGGGFVPLRTAQLVGADPATTPMGSGLVAFADAATARAYADANGARVMGYEDVVRDTTLAARLAPAPERDRENAP